MNEQIVSSEPVVMSPPMQVVSEPPPAVMVPANVVQPQAEVVVEPETPRLIQFTAYPNFVVVWPVIVLGILFSMLYAVAPTHFPERVASSLWLLSLFAVMIALGFDLDSSETAFIVMGVVVILLSLQLIAFEWQIPVFSWIGSQLQLLEVRVSANMMLVISIVLGVPYLLMMLLSRMNNHWTVVPGKLIRKTFGKSEEEIPINSTKTVNYHFYDMMMRWLCFGAGHLLVSTDKGERKIGLVLWAKRRDAQIEPFETMPVSAPVKRD